jgi:hypothetical protein
MGSLSSKPKAPSKPAPQVVYVPAPAPVAETPATPDPVEEAAQARKSSLLARDRGRFGTVLTSFRGFLAQKDASPQRKTLLGE